MTKLVNLKNNFANEIINLKNELKIAKDKTLYYKNKNKISDEKIEELIKTIGTLEDEISLLKINDNNIYDLKSDIVKLKSLKDNFANEIINLKGELIISKGKFEFFENKNKTSINESQILVNKINNLKSEIIDLKENYNNHPNEKNKILECNIKDKNDNHILKEISYALSNAIKNPEGNTDLTTTNNIDFNK